MRGSESISKKFFPGAAVVRRGRGPPVRTWPTRWPRKSHHPGSGPRDRPPQKKFFSNTPSSSTTRRSRSGPWHLPIRSSNGVGMAMSAYGGGLFASVARLNPPQTNIVHVERPVRVLMNGLLKAGSTSTLDIIRRSSRKVIDVKERVPYALKNRLHRPSVAVRPWRDHGVPMRHHHK